MFKNKKSLLGLENKILSQGLRNRKPLSLTAAECKNCYYKIKMNFRIIRLEASS